MTDRELLEMAAKAYANKDVIKSMRGFERVVGYSEVMCCQVMTEWNPLNDDGDALRLAVKLNIDIEISDFGTEAWAFDDEGDIDVHVLESANPCKLSATRRAIVRAAAQIGAQM